MPQRDFHFRSGFFELPNELPAEPTAPINLPDLEPSSIAKAMGVEDDDPFGDSPGPTERREPQPRMRAAAAAAAAGASMHGGGNSAKNNPFMDKVSIAKWDINPHRILSDLKSQ